MKKTTLSLFSAILSAFVFLLSSCSKESLSKPQEKQTVTSQLTGKMINGGTGVTGTGGIDAVILPEKAMAAVRLFSPDYISNEIFADESGFLHVTNLAEGTYTLLIYARVPGFVSKRITDIVVVDGQITDLGTITLDLDTPIDF